MSDGVSHTDTPPPSYPPPVTCDASGIVRLPIDFHSRSHISRAFENKCWKASTLAVFAPASESRTMMRSSVDVPPSLKEKGVNQDLFDAFCDDVKRAYADAAPVISTMCALMSVFTLVLAPFCCAYLCCCMGSATKAEEKLTRRLDEIALETTTKWKTRYGVRVSIEHDVHYQRPFMPAEDALVGFRSMPLRSSAWTGSVFVFAPDA